MENTVPIALLLTPLLAKIKHENTISNNINKTHNTRKYSPGNISINLNKHNVMRVIIAIATAKNLKNGIILVFLFAILQLLCLYYNYIISDFI